MFMNRFSIRRAIMTIAVLGAVLCVNSGILAGPVQFASPIAAADELMSALKQSDKIQLERVFGESPSKLLPFLGSDQKKRDNDLQDFIAAYEERHFIERNKEEAILCVGKTGWPFFIPMVSDSSGMWMFDIDKGVEELRIRQIGKNELFIMSSLNAYVDGQREFFRSNYDKGTVRTYARKFFSDKNAYNGLYWRKGKGKPESPLGPYIAWAEQRGRKGSRNKPYSGYYYKILTKQGSAAEGGEYSYIVNDKMVFGFALVAWPADYGTSGVMSFIVDHHDRIYEKDLGEDTDSMAKAIDSFNPDDSWSQVDHKWID